MFHLREREGVFVSVFVCWLVGSEEVQVRCGAGAVAQAQFSAVVFLTGVWSLWP